MPAVEEAVLSSNQGSGACHEAPAARVGSAAAAAGASAGVDAPPQLGSCLGAACEAFPAFHGAFLIAG